MAARISAESVPRLVPILCACSAGLGLATLLGWQFGVATWRTLGASPISMNPLTALGFVGLALAVVGRLRPPTRPAPPGWPTGVALGVALLGAGRLVALVGADLGVDRFLFPEALAREAIPNRMAPNTAASFLLLGLGLAGYAAPGWRDRPVAQAPFLFVLGLALLALIGHAYRLRPLYGVGTYIPMALNTALGFLMMALAGLLLRPGIGFGHLLLAPNAGGVIARRLLPLCVLAPLATGALSLAAHRRGWYDAGWAVGLSTLATIATLIALTWITAGAVDRAERQRRAAELEQQRALDQARFLNEEVKAQKARLEFMNKELESFSYSVSHDLRAPLRHISGFAELLLRFNEAQLDEKGRRRLASITGAVKQMGQLIDDLLAFSRMARSELHHTTVDMNRLLAQVRRDLAPELEGRAVRWVTADLPPVPGDESMLRQALANLLSNALKYSGTRSEAVIQVGARVADTPGATTYFVRDNGVGFDMAYGHKLFGVFQRLHPQSEFPGTGIGLANVRRIIARHGGHVWAEGVLGEGATFYFTLPDAPAEEREQWRA